MAIKTNPVQDLDQDPNSKKLSQFDKVLMALRTLVLEGELPAGSRLREVALAEKLDVSRTPLRQAMAQLIDEGLLERLDTGGCRVVRFTMEDIRDAIEFRGVVEGTAVRLAAERGISVDLAKQCEETLKQLDIALADRSNIDFDAYVLNNAKFHKLMSECSASQVIEREVERVTRLPLASPSAFLQGQELMLDFQDSLITAQSQHRAIFEAILNREGSRAEAMAREHAKLARKNLQFITQRKPNLIDRIPGLALVTT